VLSRQLPRLLTEQRHHGGHERHAHHERVSQDIARPKRSTGFFDGAAAAGHMAVLVVWAVAGSPWC
jgi:hypothetical protein